MGACFSKGATDDSSDHEGVGYSGNVQIITSKESWDAKIAETTENGQIVVANFSASWCGPCRMIAPFYSDLSVKFRSLTFLSLDVDEVSELGSSWDVRATPTFFFLKDGKQVDKLVGANKPELEKKIKIFADSIPQC